MNDESADQHLTLHSTLKAAVRSAAKRDGISEAAWQRQALFAGLPEDLREGVVVTLRPGRRPRAE